MAATRVPLDGSRSAGQAGVSGALACEDGKVSESLEAHPGQGCHQPLQLVRVPGRGTRPGP
ncbi:unnamed protein product, partial [Symbiodinium necroappetens]